MAVCRTQNHILVIGAERRDRNTMTKSTAKKPTNRKRAVSYEVQWCPRSWVRMQCGKKAPESSSVSPLVHTLALEYCRGHFRQPKSQFSTETKGLDPSSSFLSLKNESEHSKETCLLLISTLWISLPEDILNHFSSCWSCLVR